MSSVGGATSEAGALVGELSSDLVGVAPANDGQFRKTFHAPTGPRLPNWTVSTLHFGQQPGSGVTHLVDQGISQPIRAVECQVWSLTQIKQVKPRFTTTSRVITSTK